MTKQYRVGIFEEQGGYITVTAKTKSQARKMALEYASEYGLSNHKEVDVTHRDFYVVDEPQIN